MSLLATGARILTRGASHLITTVIGFLQGSLQTIADIPWIYMFEVQQPSSPLKKVKVGSNQNRIIISETLVDEEERVDVDTTTTTEACKPGASFHSRKGTESDLYRKSKVYCSMNSAATSHTSLGKESSSEGKDGTMSFTYGRPPPKIEGMVSLKVDNLTYRTTPDDLRRVFEKYGDVGDVYIPRDRWTRESRGFAFVRFYDRRDAEDAMESLDGRVLDGRELRVQMARYGRPQSPHGRSSRRRSGSRDRDRRRRRSRSPADRRHRGGGGGGGGGGERSSRRSRSRSASKGKTDRYRSRSRSASPKRSKRESKDRGERDGRLGDRDRSKDRSRSRSKSRSRSPSSDN